MKYLYVFEDGSIGYSDSEPTPSDLQSAYEGLIDIIDVQAKLFLPGDIPVPRMLKKDGEHYIQN